MARAKTGTIVRVRTGQHKGCLQAILTLADGSRKRLPPFPRGTSEAFAREKAAHYAEEVERRGVRRKAEPEPPTGTPAGESVASYIDRVFEHREARGLKRQEVERARLRNHVEPVLEARGVATMAAVSRADCEALVESLDVKIAGGDLDAKTARNIWSMWRTICKGARSAKVRALRVRDDNPTTDVEPPDKGEAKEKQWLYPEEFDRLMRCEEVPVRWRRLYALASYLCLRAGELAALEARDIDLRHGRVRIERAVDRHTKLVGTTKTGDVRTLDPPPTLRPLLESLVREAGSGRLVAFPPFESLAETLRVHCKRAGIDRPELYEKTKTSLALRWHDLRASGISWLAMDPERSQFDVRDYAGHSEVSTTDLYVRRGRAAARIGGLPFGALPERVIAGAIDHGSDRAIDSEPEAVGTIQEKKRPQRDSKPLTLRRLRRIKLDPMRSPPPDRIGLTP